jgi:hypothetical protein
VRFLVHLPGPPPLSFAACDDLFFATHKHRLEVKTASSQRLIKYACSPYDNGERLRSTQP